VLNAAWDAGLQVASENALPCYDRDGFNKILENAKPRNDPDGRNLFGFTYLRLSKVLFERAKFFEFERFVKRMHGKIYIGSSSSTIPFGPPSLPSFDLLFLCPFQVRQFLICKYRLLHTYIQTILTGLTPCGL
jgi:hypothetical protein